MSTVNSVATKFGFKDNGIIEMSKFVTENQISKRATVNKLLHLFLEECVIDQVPGFEMLYSENGDEFYKVKTENVNAEITFVGTEVNINLDWFVAGISQKGVLPSSVFLMIIGV